MKRIYKNLHWTNCTVCRKRVGTHDPKHAAKRKYCESRKCMWVGRHRDRPSPEFYIACERCGAVHCVKDRSAMEKTRYCGRRCAGLSNTKIRGNQYNYRGAKAGRQAHYKRAQGLKPAGPCERCAREGEVVHHRDHNWRNNELVNLERLCRPCHARHHHKPPLTNVTNGTNF